MDNQQESQELLQGLLGSVTTAYQTEQVTLLEQLRTRQAEKTSDNWQSEAPGLVTQVVRGTTFDYLNMLKATKAQTYATFLQAYGCANDEEFVNKVVRENLLQPEGFDIPAEINKLVSAVLNP